MPINSIWEIVDDKGTIYSGTEDEMRAIWDKVTSEEPEEECLIETWDGDLKLVQVHATFE